MRLLPPKLLLTGLCMLSCVLTAIARKDPADKTQQLRFITNGHQWPAQVHYKADVPGGAVFLTGTGFTYSYYSLADLDRIHELKHAHEGTDVTHEPVRFHAYRVTMDGCNSNARTVPRDKHPEYYNYFLGNDRTKWATGMAAYAGVRYEDIYRDIDLNVYSQGTSLKYDFIVAPGADASYICLSFSGVTPTLTRDGDLSVKTTVNELLEKAPYAYQLVNGQKQQVSCRYTLSNGRVGFEFPQGYDRSKELVIDPVLVFATYSGSTTTTYGWSATYDASGNLYAGGECFGTGWPVTTGAFQTTYGTAIDDGINKYSSNGSTLIYSTYYGGSGADYPNNMVVNASGELVVAGATTSNNLATTPGCFDNVYNGGTDFYIAHFNANGTALIGATYLGGSGNEGNASTGSGYDANRGEVFTDASGDIFVAAGTNSANFPTSPGAFQTTLNGSLDGFVCKFNSTCSSMLFGTYLGGSANDAALSILLNSAGNIVVGGGTTSTNFPGVTGGWQTTNQGGTDGFIAILNSTGTAVLSATYVGSTGNDNVSKIQIDPSDNIYAMGVNSTGTFPVSGGTYSVPGGNVYLAEFNSTLSAYLRSTTIGSTTAQTVPTAFLRDVCGNLYFVGYGATAGMPLTTNAFQSNVGGFWMCVLAQNMTALSYASYFGAAGDHTDGGSSRMDPAGIVYHSICTSSPTQPTTPTSWSPNKLTTGFDIASWKFHFQLIGVYAGFTTGSTTDTFCAPAEVHFNNTTSGGQTYLWNFGDGSPTSTAVNPVHTYTIPGLYRVSMYAYNTGACSGVDSAFHTIFVRGDSLTASATLTPNDSGCVPYTVTFNNTSLFATAYSWDWGDGTPGATTPSPSHTYTIPGTYTIRLVALNPTRCKTSDTTRFTVTALVPGATALFSLTGNDSLCLPGAVGVTNSSTNATDYLWDFGDGSATSTASVPPPHSYTAAGTYTLKLYAYNRNYWACIPVDSAMQTIHVFDIQTPVLTVHDTLVCVPDKIELEVGIANYANTMSIAWTPIDHIFTDPTQAKVYVDATQSMLYSVTVTNSIPGICSVHASADIHVNLWNKFVGTRDTLICPHDTAQLVTIGTYERVRWTPANYISDDTARNPQVWPSHNLTYTIYGQYLHCVDTELYTINIAPAAVTGLPDSVLIYPGESYQMNPQGNCLYYSWFPGSGLDNMHIANPVATPEVHTRYFINATTEYGCKVKDSIDVHVSTDSYIDMPNAFAPGSGPNGRLAPVHIGAVKLKSFRIFNRWGTTVFQTTDINEGWDGTFNGTPQPMGAYVYMVEALTPAGRKFYKQGNVTLIR